jgi:hypothetical protein
VVAKRLRARSTGLAEPASRRLVITVDTPVAGMRERDRRNGMKELLGTSLFAEIPYVPDIIGHPGWHPMLGAFFE